MLHLMDDRSTLLMIRYKAEDGSWKRAHPARAANGRLRNGTAMIGGVPTPVEQFCYQVRHYEDRKTKWTTVGANAADAEAQRLTIQQQVSIRAAAPEANMVVVEGPQRRTLKETAAEFVRMKEESHRLESAMKARMVAEEFIQVVKKTYVDEIKPTDFAKFHSALFKRGLSDRTVSNKHGHLSSWLVYGGIDKSIITPAPRYEETLPTIYERDQITTLLGEADPYMTMVINIAWKCGLRDQELMYLEFSDINQHEHTLRVQGKKEYGFKVKDSEQRDIPLMDDLLDDLKAWKKSHPKQSLVLALNGKPNTHLRRMLQHVARKAGLNCGKCNGCRSNDRVCENYTLHHFRRTYITTMLRKGWDLRTVQAWAGHSDLASTMRYLRPAAGEEVRAKLKAMEW
jgi:integrase